MSTGKYVDDELFLFGLQCNYDHPARSFIMDPDGKNFLSYNVFTHAELKEIVEYKEQKRPQPSKDFKCFLNKFNKSTSEQLREALKNNNTFSKAFDPEEDWAIYTVYSLLREYEGGNLDRKHKEVWYQSHIWSMIETCLDIVEGLEAVIGEPHSFATRKRKNKDRAISSLEAMPRMAYGHRCDLVFRMYDVGHSVPCEFGASEAGAKDEDTVGTKFINESFYKLPRVLKDMLDCLLERVNFDQRSTSVRTVGFLHSGLACTLIELDRPTTYCTFQG